MQASARRSTMAPESQARNAAGTHRGVLAPADGAEQPAHALRRRLGGAGVAELPHRGVEHEAAPLRPPDLDGGEGPLLRVRVRSMYQCVSFNPSESDPCINQSVRARSMYQTIHPSQFHVPAHQVQIHEPINPFEIHARVMHTEGG